MNDIYAKAYTEVLEILSYFDEEEYSKIPREKIEFYEMYRDKNYNYKINPALDLSKQNISAEANAILVSLFRDYFATESQKVKLSNLLNQNQEIVEKEKRKKYSTDVFHSQENGGEGRKKENLEQTKQLCEYKETFFTKFINFIKRLIGIE